MKGAILLLLCIISSCFGDNCPTNTDKVIVCYYSSWSTYREDIGFFNLTEHIDPNLCTHLVYTFAGLDFNSKIKSLDPNNDIDKDSYKSFTNKLKVANPCLKTLLAIGGWNEGSKKYSVMSYSQESREAFADSVLRFLVEYDFDGLDVDWEYPTERGGVEADKANFIELIKTLHAKLKVWNLMVTIAVPMSTYTLQKAYDFAKLIPYLDYVLLMAYDFTNAASKTTGLSSPMQPIKDAVDWLLQKKVPANKLVLGVATYARSYTLEKSTNNVIGANATGPGEPGKHTKEPGFLSYYELQAKLATNRYKRQLVDGTYYAYYNLEWMTFDLLDTYTAKVQYALDKKLRGIMVWTIDTDDFLGLYGKTKYPIIQTVRDVLYKK